MWQSSEWNQLCDTRLSKQGRHIVQHNISGNLITVLTLAEIITTDLLHKHHMTPELNLKTNQAVRDYAAALALHLNDGRRTHSAVAKCGVCMRKCLSERWFEHGVTRWESKRRRTASFTGNSIIVSKSLVILVAFTWFGNIPPMKTDFFLLMQL